MATLGLVNIGALATGVLGAPRPDADAILVEDGRIAALGSAARAGAGGADVVVDCHGTTVIPGLIDSHCHVVLGDYTPRQKTVDFLDSYVGRSRNTPLAKRLATFTGVSVTSGSY